MRLDATSEVRDCHAANLSDIQIPGKSQDLVVVSAPLHACCLGPCRPAIAEENELQNICKRT